jgi:YfiH family protein
VFCFRDTVEGDLGIQVAFTDSSLDVGDRAEESVRRSALEALAAETGATPVLMHQVHGASVHQVAGPGEAVPDADGLVTSEPGLALLARAADCVPVLLADPVTGHLGAVHAGRNGVLTGVVTVAVDRLRELGATDLRAWIGPHVCGGCYEVPEAMRAEVADVVPATHSVTTWGTPALDLGAGVTAQLAVAGVPSTDVAVCTVEDDRVPSHRRDAERAGRFAGVVWRPR